MFWLNVFLICVLAQRPHKPRICANGSDLPLELVDKFRRGRAYSLASIVNHLKRRFCKLHQVMSSKEAEWDVVDLCAVFLPRVAY
jgi:hypothetical protein